VFSFKQFSKWSPYPKFYSLHQILSINIIFGYKHMSFTILVYRLLLHCLTFLFVVSIAIALCEISYLSYSLLRLYFLGSSSSSSKPLNFFLVFDYAFVVSIPSKFFHYYFCAPCNMATFHAFGCLDLTITVDDFGMTTIFKHFLCAMFTFQPCSLHISKDISYDYNIFFSSSLYHIPTTSS
jgi:hypothetical protein